MEGSDVFGCIVILLWGVVIWGEDWGVGGGIGGGGMKVDDGGVESCV